MLRPFIGVDGEGGNIYVVDTAGTCTVRHVYLLLRAGPDHVLETGQALSPYECLGFLADLPTNAIYVAFAFDYDVSMIIRSLPPNRVDALLDKKRRIQRDSEGKETGRHWPVDVGEFQIDYMPRKEFRVRRVKREQGNSGAGKVIGRSPWVVISDVFTFFQCRFTDALERWLPEKHLEPLIEQIKVGKAQRNSFGGVVTEDERQYNLLEIYMLQIMMERFREMCSALEIYPRKWQGPGQLVNAVFQREGVPRNRFNNVNPQVRLWANAAYYGGRFEASTYGDIPGPIYQYDINSAYASYYKRLPCLVHGEWKAFRKLPKDGIYFANVRFKHPEGMMWNTLPLRNPRSGTLLFPMEGNGWYWMHEIRTAIKYGAEIEVKRGYRYVQTCDCEPFDWVYRLYDERIRVGKDSGKGKVLKTTLATIYGKLAQSIGVPPYANPIWSGLVVSYCRATLIDAALQRNGGRDVVMLATDGLFSREPRDLPCSPTLGEWTMSQHESIFIVQSGLYFIPGHEPKTRGTPQSLILKYEDEFRHVWDEWIQKGDVEEEDPHVIIPIRMFMSARIARAWRMPWMTGQWITARKKVVFNWCTKRCEPRIISTYMETQPIAGSEWFISAPHRRIIGGELSDPERREATERERAEAGLMLGMEDQPDFGDHLLWDGDLDDDAAATRYVE